MDNVIINEKLNKDDFINLISKYYHKKLKHDINIKYKYIFIKNIDKNPIIVLLYNNKRKVILKNNEIKNVIENYVNDMCYELDSFKYENYDINNNEIFDGVTISMYRSNLSLIKCLIKKRK